MVGKNRAVIALGGLVQLDLKVLDGGSFDLLGDAPPSRRAKFARP
jgi:hypothetical protein